MKKLLPLLLLAVSLFSCHALGPALSALDALTNDSQQVLKIVETTFNVYESQHPVEPADRKTFQDLLANAYFALNTASRTLRGADKLNQGEYDAAVADFKKSYEDLTRFLKNKQVSPGSSGLVGASATANGGEFPVPALIGYRVE